MNLVGEETLRLGNREKIKHLRNRVEVIHLGDPKNNSVVTYIMHWGHNLLCRSFKIN